MTSHAKGRLQRYGLGLVAFGACFFSSCQKVVHIDLNSASPKLVIDGEVNNLAGPYSIKLGRTTNYFGGNTYSAETGASVIITDNAGNKDTLREGTTVGRYSSSHLVGTMGRNYALIISTQGQQYVAVQNMMDTVHIDSIAYTIRVNQSNHPQYIIGMKYTDPPALGNCYGFRVYRNGTLHSNIINNRIVTDQLSNGGPYLINFRNSDFVLHDTLKIELVSFSKNTYDFYYTIKQTLESGSPFSAPPANPVTDINNGALGFFGAFAITSRTIVLQ